MVQRRRMEKYNLTVTIWKEGSMFVSKCPELGVASCGDTTEEALENLKEAVDLYIENAKKLGMMDDISAAVTSHHKFTSNYTTNSYPWS